jgi:hypothetical protein
MHCRPTMALCLGQFSGYFDADIKAALLEEARRFA